MNPLSNGKVWTADELLAMTPKERNRGTDPRIHVARRHGAASACAYPLGPSDRLVSALCSEIRPAGKGFHTSAWPRPKQCCLMG